MRVPLQLALALFGLAKVDSFPGFQQAIPNGNRILGCDGLAWPGVGHFARNGGGPRNPFGAAFDANSFTWTVEFCQADSDGDGLTNGEELGDPNCQWTPTNGAALQEPIGHPGFVCEEIQGNTSNPGQQNRTDPPEYVYEFPAAQWAHGMLMLFAWVVLAPLGILFSMCNKTKVPPPVQNWFKFHQAIMLTVLILTLISFIIIVNDLGELRFFQSHNAVGFTVVILSVVQFFGGVFRIHHKPQQPKSTIRLVWEYGHQWFGRSTLILAITAAVLGLELLGIGLNATNVTDGIRYTIVAIFIASSVAAFLYVLFLREDQRVHTAQKETGKGNADTKEVYEDRQAEGDVTKF